MVDRYDNIHTNNNLLQDIMEEQTFIIVTNKVKYSRINLNQKCEENFKMLLKVVLNKEKTK